MVHGLSKVSRSGLPHLSDNESTDLSGRVVLALCPNPSVSVGMRDDLEGNVVKIFLNFSILELSSDKSVTKPRCFSSCMLAKLNDNCQLTAWWQIMCFRG